MDSLTQTREVRLPAGVLRYRDSGAGEPIVLVHGLLVDGRLWRKVAPELEASFRCIVPDLPFGAHELPLEPKTDLSPPGLAALVADFLAALELEHVTLVGNDTGGAVCQLVATRHAQRLGRLVLTPCDAFENFLPLVFRYLQWSARLPGAIAMLMQPMRIRALRRLPIAYGWLSKRPVERAISDAWVRPILSNPLVRRDAIKVLRGISNRYTMEAAEKLRAFDRPTLLAWAPEDRFFPWAHAERLAAAIPNARLERIDDSYTFVPEDQPRRVAELIADFAKKTG